MLDYFSATVGTILIIFIICICLVIFAPKSHNFYDIDTYYPELNKLKNSIGTDNDVIKDTFVKLDINLTGDNMFKEYNEYKQTLGEVALPAWVEWPDKNIISNKGGVCILPIYLFSKIYKSNKKLFAPLFKEISKMPGIKSIFFIKLDPGSKFIKHNNWDELANNSLRYIFCFNSFCYSDKECGIWVNGEIKKLYKDSAYVYDSSIEHSIYNNTFDSICFLIVDIERPDMPIGISDYKIPYETQKNINEMSAD